MPFSVSFLDFDELEDLISKGVMKNLDDNIYIVKGFFDPKFIDEIKNFCLQFSSTIPDGWFPCLDECPDYHRFHNNYEQAYVKAVQHAFYFHPWNENKNIFSEFLKIFELKLKCMDNKLEVAPNYLNNLPSDGVIARIVVHQYPCGGGGQQEHIDPVSPYARIQTIIQASEPGKDYISGGLYVNHHKFGIVNIDKFTQKGDLIILSPGIRHGVDKIDPEKELDWSDTRGRWIIMPIILNSDVKPDIYGKPKMSKKV